MLNFSIDAPGVYPLGPYTKRPAAAVYHSPIRTSHFYGGHFFTPGAIPQPSPMPESHSP
jgi:hypothetical protein